MIFFVSNDGSVIKTLPSPVYQGAANANNIYLVAPFASNMSVTVAFRLANGVWTPPYIMTPHGTVAAPNGEMVDEKTKKNYAVWTFSMPSDITRYYGTVTAQFFFYASNGNAIIASSAASFTVGRGVPAILPDTPTEDVYEAILSNLSALQEQLDNGVFTARSIYAWNPTYAYGANEIVFVPKEREYGSFVKSLISDNKNPPYDALGELNPTWAVVADFDEIYTLVRYGIAVENATLKFSPLDPNVSVAGENLIIQRSL